MSILRRNQPPHEEVVREDVDITDADTPAETRPSDSPVPAEQYEAPTDTIDDGESNEESEFESDVKKLVGEIASMTVDELLADAADDIARSELEDNDAESMWYIVRATAVGNRAIALLLQQQIQLQQRTDN